MIPVPGTKVQTYLLTYLPCMVPLQCCGAQQCIITVLRVSKTLHGFFVLACPAWGSGQFFFTLDNYINDFVCQIWSRLHLFSCCHNVVSWTRFDFASFLLFCVYYPFCLADHLRTVLPDVQCVCSKWVIGVYIICNDS